MKIHTYRVLSSSRLGYRGAVLLVLSFIDVVYGLWIAFPSPDQARTQAFVWRDQIMPTQAWGAVWIGVGLVIAANAFLQQDRIGYGVAIAIKFAWAFIALVSGLHDHVSGAYTQVTVWLGVAVLAIIESGRAEPVQSHEVTVLDTEDGSDQ